MNQINEFQETLKYKPTKPQFKEATLDSPGFWSFSEIQENCESTETMSALVQSWVEVENIIKKNFLVIKKDVMENAAEGKDYLTRNPIQLTLREEFEEVSVELIQIKAKYKNLINQLYSKSTDDKNRNQNDLQSQIE